MSIPFVLLYVCLSLSYYPILTLFRVQRETFLEQTPVSQGGGDSLVLGIVFIYLGEIGFIFLKKGLQAQYNCHRTGVKLKLPPRITQYRRESV